MYLSQNKKAAISIAVYLIAAVGVILLYLVFSGDTFDRFTGMLNRETKLKVELDDDGSYILQKNAGKCPCDNEEGVPKYYDFRDKVLERSKTSKHLANIINMEALEKEMAEYKAQPRISEADYDLLEKNFYSNNLRSLPFTGIEFLVNDGKKLCLDASPAECTPKQFAIEFLENKNGEPIPKCETPKEECTRLYYAKLELIEKEEAGILT